MLKINYEFRKGIFFIRLIGVLTDKNYQRQEEELKRIIIENKFKYIVINTNYLKTIDLDGLSYLIEIFNITEENDGNLIICDTNNIFNRLLNKNIPSIKNEIELL